MIYYCTNSKKKIKEEKSRNSKILEYEAYSMYFKTYIYNMKNNVVFLLRSMRRFIKLMYSIFFSKISILRIAIIYFYIYHVLIRIYCSDDDEEPLRKKIKIDERTQLGNNITELNRKDIEFIYNYFYTKLCVKSKNTVVEKFCFSMGQLFANSYLSNNFNENLKIDIHIEELILSILQLDLNMETRCNNFDILNDFDINDLKEEYKDNELKFYNFKVIYEFITIFCGKIQVESIEYIFLSDEFLKKNSEIDIKSLLLELKNSGLLTKKTKTLRKLVYIFDFWIKLTSINISEEEKNSFVNGKLFEKIKYDAHKQSICLKNRVYIYPNYINNNYFGFTNANFLSLRNMEDTNVFGIQTRKESNSTIKKFLLSSVNKNKSEISVNLIFEKVDISENMYKSYKTLFNSIVDFILFENTMSTTIQDENDFIFGSYIYTQNIFQITFLRKIKNIIKNFPKLGFTKLDSSLEFITNFLTRSKIIKFRNILLHKEFNEILYNYVRKPIESYNKEIITLLYFLNENDIIVNNKNRDKYMKFIEAQINFMQKDNINNIKLVLKNILDINGSKIKSNIHKFLIEKEKKTLQHLEALILYNIYTIYLYCFIFLRISDLINHLSITQIKEIWKNYFDRFVRDKDSNQEEKKVFETFFVSLHLLMKHFDVIVQKYALCKKDNHTA